MSYSGHSTLTSKGQITLPASLREYLGLQPGDTIEFFQGYDGSIKVRARTRPANAIVGLLSHLKPSTAYADDDEAIAAEVQARDEASRRRSDEAA